MNLSLSLYLALTQSSFFLKAAKCSGYLPRGAPDLGWHYLSNATCLIRPHLFSTAFLV